MTLLTGLERSTSAPIFSFLKIFFLFHSKLIAKSMTCANYGEILSHFGVKVVEVLLFLEVDSFNDDC